MSLSIKFTKVTLRNFLSYGQAPTEFELDRPGTTFVIGRDLDNLASGTGGNGCGKTAILNAIVFAVYDKPLSNISKENLINNVNRKNMEVTIEFEKNGTQYAVRRVRKGKTGASVHLFQDGKDITPDSIKLTNQEIEKIIGVPYELFVRIIAFSANKQSFLELTTAAQRDIIEELFELKILSERAVELKEHIKTTEQNMRLQAAHVDQLESEHLRHESQLESAKKRVINWEVERKKEIANIQSMLASVNGIDIDAQKEYHKQAETLRATLNETSNLKAETKRSVDKQEKDRNVRSTELKSLEKAECPYCHQKHQDWDRISELQDWFLDSNDTFARAKTKLEELESKLKDDAQAVVDVEAQIEIEDIDSLLEIRSKQSQYQDRLEHLEGEDNPHLEALEELEAIKLEPVDKSKLNELADEIDHQKFLLKLLTKNDSFIRKTLLNKNIPYLNQRLAKYLPELGLLHNVRFNQNMTVSISRFGRDIDYGNLSNGQQARVNFALSLAFRDMLENIHGKINVYMLDEILDVGLDSLGIQAAAKVLKNKSRDEQLSVYIISHKDELSNAFEKKLYITMRKGFSYVEDQ